MNRRKEILFRAGYLAVLIDEYRFSYFNHGELKILHQFLNRRNWPLIIVEDEGPRNLVLPVTRHTKTKSRELIDLINHCFTRDFPKSIGVFVWEDPGFSERCGRMQQALGIPKDEIARVENWIEVKTGEALEGDIKEQIENKIHKK